MVAVSVSLPMWADNVGYEEGDPRVIKAMKGKCSTGNASAGGYPRFVFHPLIKKLFDFCLEKFSTVSDESCLILNSRKACQECREFMLKRIGNFSRFAPAGSQLPLNKIRLVEYILTPATTTPNKDFKAPTVYLILFHSNYKDVAKEYWQHTGAGISSRFAEHCLVLLDMFFPFPRQSTLLSGRQNSAGPSFKKESKSRDQLVMATTAKGEADLFVEERFGRNLDPSLVEEAKLILRKRIAGVLGDAKLDTSPVDPTAAPDTLDQQNTPRGSSRAGICEQQVFLFNSGMAAIYFSHQVVTTLAPGLKTVQFG
ncbi:hypothetical protein HDU91_000323 [Kappamyces sp. JEL0680]|nr:hypothetical protein HDU91_000323 [Kappamyces sp. JEL0680]